MAKRNNPEPSPNTPGSGPLKKARCPRCGKEYLYESVAKHKTFPFCSPRCREVDLGNWLSGKYVIPGKEDPKLDEAFEESTPESDDDGT